MITPNLVKTPSQATITIQLTPTQTTTTIQISVTTSAIDSRIDLFHVGLGVVFTLLALIAAAIILLLVVLLYPKNKQKTNLISPEPCIRVECHDTPSTLEPPGPNNNTEHVLSSSVNTGTFYTPTPNDVSTQVIAAYAISNVQSTAAMSLGSRKLTHDYDYAEP